MIDQRFVFYKIRKRTMQLFVKAFILLHFMVVVSLLTATCSIGSCGPLDAAKYPCDVIVSGPDQLRNAVSTAGAGNTICLETGTYHVSNLWVSSPGVTIRSASGERELVIIDGNYASSQSILNIRGDSVTIADLTIQRSWYHPVHVSGGGHNVLLHNLHIIDGREQFVKVNPNGDSGNDNGVLECSLLELTDTGREFIQKNADGYPCYTGGIDTHAADGWVVRDNVFRNIYCEDYDPDKFELAEHAVHFWSETSNTTVERNKIINCARGIGFGLGSSGNSGGVIKNNMVYQGGVSGIFDVGISLESSPGTEMYNNTVYLTDYSNGIEYRFTDTTNITIQNNLTNMSISDRSSGCGAGDCTVNTNSTNAQPDWFTDVSVGDLHLATAIDGVVDQGIDLLSVEDDFDGGPRLSGSYDIGADEYEIETLAGDDSSPSISSILMLLL
ncbi:right-handed parallel beta-helix repeat-containing protein [Desulforhopalus sp. 52FAK]